MAKNKKIVILYHKDCPDGFGAAWAAHKKFGKKAEYIGVIHQTPRPKNLKNKEVYLLDFSYPEKEMEKLAKEAKFLAIIDHHISAKERIKFTNESIFKLEHSGAFLAWKYFHPKKPTPKLLLHIEDMDLWKFKLNYTKEIMAELGTYDFDFKTWDKFQKEIEDKTRRKKLAEKGREILRCQDKIIEDIARKAYPVSFEKHDALAVNSSSSMLNSQTGHRLVEKGYPIGIVWYQIKNRIKVSLRGDGKIDLSKIAEKYGGGGHKSAASFFLDAKKPFPWKLKKQL